MKTSRDGWVDMPAKQPHVCLGCGRKIVLRGPEPLMFKTFPPLASWHTRCLQAAQDQERERV